MVISKMPPNSIARVSVEQKEGEIWINEVLESNTKDEEAEAFLAQELLPVTFHDEILGEFVLNKRVTSFETNIAYNSKKVMFVIYSKDYIDTAHSVYNNLPELIEQANKYASDELLELANKWAECEDATVTEADFISRMTLDFVIIVDETNYQLWFEDGDLFFGHAIAVYGNTETGLWQATMEG